MQVTVELQTYLEQYSPDGRPLFQYTLPEGATVQTLVRQLNVSEELASVIVINDRLADSLDPLHEGDRVTLIPPMAGGQRTPPPFPASADERLSSVTRQDSAFWCPSY